MALVSVSEKEKRKIIWNFMKELLENYENAMENNIPAIFNFMDFFNFGNLAEGSEDD